MRLSLPALGAALLIVSSCAPSHRQIKSNALEYLYPNGAAAAPATEVRLKVPVRVGIAFAPPRSSWQESFTEEQKQALLAKIAAAFRERTIIGSVQEISTMYLQPGGGFADLDRVAAAYGIDLVVLVSYDQVQFSDTTAASLAYWTIVGAYIVKGEKNETKTMLDAAVFDIPSRAMLFTASGRSGVTGHATPLGAEQALRSRSEEGFQQATDDLIVNLNTSLEAFRTQAATGTVRGPGTPLVTIVDGAVGSEGGSGGGSAGGLDAAALALLVAAGWWRWRAR
ncbi:MAG TPA: rhombotarget lipoprotein [Candidatus Polarisedimenticolaceae bacterium]|nr:rhombotarget lipoprotein [Candidatus Polarisedimenticolaceae bacterium]